MQFFINPVNIIISHNSMPSFHYQCVLFNTYNNLGNILSKNNFAEFLVWALPMLSVNKVNIIILCIYTYVQRLRMDISRFIYIYIYIYIYILYIIIIIEL